jgi:hypothetical protein
VDGAFELDLQPDQTRPLRFRVRPAASLVKSDRPPAVAPLEIAAALGDRPQERRTASVGFHLPPPDVVELTAERLSPGGGRVSETARSEGRSGVGLGRVVCHTFPNRATEYLLALRNRSGRARKVTFQLWQAPDVLPLGNLPASRWLDELQLRGFEPLVPPLAIDLAADERPVAVPFPAPKPEKADQAAEKPGAQAADSPGGVSSGQVAPGKPAHPMTHWLLAVVRDADNPPAKESPWVWWLELSLVRPWEYLEPSLFYSAERQRIEVRLKLVRDPQYLPPVSLEAPIQVHWEPDEVLSELAASGAAPIAADYIKDLAAEAMLSWPIDPASNQAVEVRLAVDGYARAFVFRKFRPSQAPAQVEVNRDLRALKVVSPVSGQAFRSPLKTPLFMEVQVDAPRDAWHKGVLQAGIDKDGNGRLDPGEIAEQYPLDRQEELFLQELGPSGVMRLETRVHDFRIPLPLDRLGWSNMRVTLIARPVWDDWLDAPEGRANVVLDGRPPVIGRIDVDSRPVQPGRDVEVRVTTEPDLSGVEQVEFGFDKNNNGLLDDDERIAEATQTQPISDNQWRAMLPTAGLRPGGSYYVVARAKDRVGWISAPRRAGAAVVIAEPAPKEESAAPAGPKFSSIQGRVYLGSPDTQFNWIGLDVWIAENGRRAETHSSGDFVFRDLPPGTYTLNAKGIAGNRDRQGSRTVMLTEQPVHVDIKME